MIDTHLIRKAKLYSGCKEKAFAVAKSYKEGDESTTEYICSGDPAYLVLIAMNLLIEASERLDVPEEILESMLGEIKKEILKAESTENAS